MEYEKQQGTLQRNVTLIIIVATICCLGLYLCMFNNGLSNNSNSWSNFGDYVNGVLTPIFTVINIYVFIKLTTTISRLEEKRYENSMEIENQRREKEIKHEKDLLLMQFRKQEIETFVKQMNRIDNSPLDIVTLKEIANYLKSFNNTGAKWFNVEKSGITSKIGLMWTQLLKVIESLETNNKYDVDASMKIYDLKAEITNILMEATLGNTEDNQK